MQWRMMLFIHFEIQFVKLLFQYIFLYWKRQIMCAYIICVITITHFHQWFICLCYHSLEEDKTSDVTELTKNYILNLYQKQKYIKYRAAWHQALVPLGETSSVFSPVVWQPAKTLPTLKMLLHFCRLKWTLVNVWLTLPFVSDNLHGRVCPAIF